MAAEQEALRKKQEELEAKLQEQIRETERMAAKKEREMRERSLLDEKVLKTIPLVNEANAISDELSKGMNFGVKLLATQTAPRPVFDEAGDGAEEAKGSSEMMTDVFVRVEFEGGNRPTIMWHYDKFMNRLYIMREMYSQFVECGRDVSATGYTDDNDPFYDPPEAQVIGCATIYLDTLQYLLSISEATPVMDYKGKEEGELVVKIVPHLSETPPAFDEEDDPTMPDKIELLRGRKLGITIYIDSARGLPKDRSSGAYVEFQFFMDEQTYKTPPCQFRTINPKFEYCHTFWVVSTEAFERYVSTGSMVFKIYGNTGGDDAAAPRPATTAQRIATPQPAPATALADTAELDAVRVISLA